MCRMTLIDYDENKVNITHDMVRHIITLNTLEGNYDGFGYYLFQKNKLVKSALSGIEYLRRFRNTQFAKYANIKGLYHVRKATGILTNGSNIADIVQDKNSHPFSLNGLVATHNGSLIPRELHIKYDMYKDILENKDTIDSEKFIMVLNEEVKQNADNSCLSYDNIVNAVNLFSGPFCFFLHDIDDKNKVWVVRGKQRILWELSILDNKNNPIGIVINTSDIALGFLAEELYPLKTALTLLSDETTYVYNINSYSLEKVGKITENSSYEHVPSSNTTRAGNQHYSSSSIQATWGDEKIYLNIIDLVAKFRLTFSEIIYLCENCFHHSFTLLTFEESKQLNDILLEMEKEFYPGRSMLWNKILDSSVGNSRLQLYRKLNLEFPYFLNARSRLQIACDKLKLLMEDTKDGILN